MTHLSARTATPLSLKALLSAAFCALLCLLLFAPAQAAIDVIPYSTTESFYLEADTSPLALCSCQSYTGTFGITNTGAVETAVLLSTESPLPLSLSSSSATIPVGQKRVISYTIEAACGAPSVAVSESTLRITASSASGKTLSYERQLRVGKCQNLAAEASISGNSTRIGPCQNLTGAILVQNTGPFSDTYTFSVDSKARLLGASVAKTSTILAAGAYERIPFTLQFTCDAYGERNAEVRVASLRNGLTATIPLAFSIAQDYPYALRLPSSKEVCELDNATVYATLTNYGMIPNTFDLTFSNPREADSFISWPATTSHALGSGDEALIQIIIHPVRGDAGNYSIGIDSLSALGKVPMGARMPFVVIPCYDITVTASVQSDASACSGFQSVPFTIKNNGRFDERINLHLSGADHLSLDDDSIALSPGQEKTIVAQGNAPDATQTAFVTLTATLRNGVSAKASTTLSVIDQKSCHALSGSDRSLHTTGYQRSELAIPLVSNAIGTEDYSIALVDPPDWITLGAGEVELRSRDTVAVKLTLDPQADTPPGTFSALIRAIPLSNPSLSYDIPVRIELVKPSIIERVYAFIKDHRCPQVALWLLLALVVLAAILITLDKHAFSKRFRRENRKKLQVFGLLAAAALLVIIALALGVRVPTAYPQLPQTHDMLAFTWYEGDSYTVDLSTYFFSPEGERLTYAASPNLNVDIRFEGAVATLTPKRGYAGVSYTTFTATDEGNNTGSSPLVKLDVVAVPTPSPVTVALAYCPVFNTLLLAAIVFLMYWMLLVRKREEKQ